MLLKIIGNPLVQYTGVPCINIRILDYIYYITNILKIQIIIIIIKKKKSKSFYKQKYDKIK
jgi:hypothetical protein